MFSLVNQMIVKPRSNNVSAPTNSTRKKLPLKLDSFSKKNTIESFLNGLPNTKFLPSATNSFKKVSTNTNSAKPNQREAKFKGSNNINKTPQKIMKREICWKKSDYMKQEIKRSEFSASSSTISKAYGCKVSVKYVQHKALLIQNSPKNQQKRVPFTFSLHQNIDDLERRDQSIYNDSIPSSTLRNKELKPETKIVETVFDDIHSNDLSTKSEKKFNEIATLLYCLKNQKETKSITQSRLKNSYCTCNIPFKSNIDTNISNDEKSTFDDHSKIESNHCKKKEEITQVTKDKSSEMYQENKEQHSDQFIQTQKNFIETYPTQKNKTHFFNELEEINQERNYNIDVKAKHNKMKNDETNISEKEFKCQDYCLENKIKDDLKFKNSSLSSATLNFDFEVNRNLKSQQLQPSQTIEMKQTSSNSFLTETGNLRPPTQVKQTTLSYKNTLAKNFIEHCTNYKNNGKNEQLIETQLQSEADQHNAESGNKRNTFPLPNSQHFEARQGLESNFISNDIGLNLNEKLKDSLTNSETGNFVLKTNQLLENNNSNTFKNENKDQLNYHNVELQNIYNYRDSESLSTCKSLKTNKLKPLSSLTKFDVESKVNTKEKLAKFNLGDAMAYALYGTNNLTDTKLVTETNSAKHFVNRGELQEKKTPDYSSCSTKLNCKNHLDSSKFYQFSNNQSSFPQNQASEITSITKKEVPNKNSVNLCSTTAARSCHQGNHESPLCIHNCNSIIPCLIVPCVFSDKQIFYSIQSQDPNALSNFKVINNTPQSQLQLQNNVSETNTTIVQTDDQEIQKVEPSNEKYKKVTENSRPRKKMAETQTLQCSNFAKISTVSNKTKIGLKRKPLCIVPGLDENSEKANI